jgi:hypothetical protein
VGTCVNSGLAYAPDWTPHRINVTAADGATDTDESMADGMVSQPFEDAYADVYVEGGSGVSLTVEVMFWSELAGAFVSQNPVVNFTGISGSEMLSFHTGCNRFKLNVTGTFGGATVSISCAGHNPVGLQSV